MTYTSTSTTTSTTTTSTSSSSSTSSFGVLHPEIERALKSMGIDQPTEIQSKTLPHLIAGKDMFIVDDTGTGKSFMLMCGIVNDYITKGRLVARPKQMAGSERTSYPRYLVVTPNRELVWQFGEWFRRLSAHVTHKPSVVIAVSGPSKMLLEQQMSEIQPDIIVGTPNLIYEMIMEQRLAIDALRMLVYDEADALLQALSRNATYKEKLNRKAHRPIGVSLIYELSQQGIELTAAGKKQDVQTPVGGDGEAGVLTDKHVLDLIQNKSKPASQYKHKRRPFQSIFSSATLTLRNRLYIDGNDWVNEDREYITIISRKMNDPRVPAHLTHSFVPVQSEQGMMNAIVSKWRTLQPRRAIAVMPNDGSNCKGD
ncbi:hypothetical protein SAMD00019534_110240 [Acytostelium subglobosum LB1]|uniref:hypothetical protein n=1 Tax=Acytostelium subglobosum LB1 TaxID=1410327 RepID=UPI00064483B0|nr:hypothetical protein SAMD00019534_110240 [Acytostelium subglobosum LB1]GAM27848.1 hypothetical protein SAMD00019534_110240 [Acytostelium subglobosum LB1]|eukprot:XP_012749131.1 hypothetical protein SAMD00019534_110240 [Acytostelium subglobosum LB1]